jgi:hypothetical protein
MYGAHHLPDFVNSTSKFNPTIVKVLKLVLCSSRDGVPLNVKNKSFR